jgi:hypothetical protein
MTSLSLTVYKYPIIRKRFVICASLRLRPSCTVHRPLKIYTVSQIARRSSSSSTTMHGSLLLPATIIPVLKSHRHHRRRRRLHCDLRISRPITVRLPRDTISEHSGPSSTGRNLFVMCASLTIASVWLPFRGTVLQTAPPRMRPRRPRLAFIWTANYMAKEDFLSFLSFNPYVIFRPYLSLLPFSLGGHNNLLPLRLDINTIVGERRRLVRTRRLLPPLHVCPLL